MDARTEMVQIAADMSDPELDLTLAMASMGQAMADECPDEVSVNDTNAVWIEVLTQEKQHRETGEPV